MKIASIFMAILLFSVIPFASAQSTAGFHPWDSPAWMENATVNDVLSEITKSLDDLYDQIDKLNENSYLPSAVAGLTEDSMDLKKSVSALSAKIDDMESEIQDLSNRLDALEAKRK